MKAESFNRQVVLQDAEKQAIIKELTAAGIDKSTAESLFVGRVAACQGGDANGCVHDPGKGCTTYFGSPKQEAVEALKQLVKTKGIDIRSMPNTAKLLQ